jgi:hypothetical protein
MMPKKSWFQRGDSDPAALNSTAAVSTVINFRP